MKRLQLLDYGRFIAAMSVLVFHYFFNGIQNGKISSITHIPEVIGIAKYGYLGVVFFFMISGYVIFLSAKNKSASEFAISRATRLYPAFWAAVIFTSFFSMFWGGKQMTVTPAQILANLTMEAPLFDQNFVDGVYWTLTYELNFYLLIFVLILFGAGNKLETIFLLWPFLITITVYLEKDYLPYLGSYYSYFSAGVILAIIKEKKTLLSYLSLLITLILCINFSASETADLIESKKIFYSEQIIATIVTSFFIFFIILNTKIASNINLYGSSLLGNVTYPIYLIHAHFGYMFISHFATEDNKIFIYIVTIVIVFSIAYLIHILVEKRYSMYWKRFFKHCIYNPIELINLKLSNYRYESILNYKYIKILKKSNTSNRHNKFRNDLSLATKTSIFSFIISLGLSPVMSRWYEPSDYGIFAVINNWATFIATALLFSLPNAIPMEHRWTRQIQLLRTLAHLSVFVFIVSVICVVLLLGYDKILNQFDDSEWVYLSLPFLIFAISLHRIAQGWANADGAFSSMAKARIAHQIIAKPFSILASILTTSNPIYIVFFELFGYCVQAYLMMRGRKCKLKILKAFLTLRSIKMTFRVVHQYRDYSLFLNLVNLLSLGYIMIQTVILSINYSIAETGLFSLAMSMASLPIQLIAMATASIIYHKLIEIADKNPKLLFKSTIKILLGYMLVGFVPYSLIYIFGVELFQYIFGNGWAQSGTIASILAIPLFLQFFSTPIFSIYRVTKTIKSQFFINLIFTILSVLIFYVSSFNMPFYKSLNILAITMSIHGLVIIFSCLYVAWSFSKDESERNVLAIV